MSSQSAAALKRVATVGGCTYDGCSSKNTTGLGYCKKHSKLLDLSDRTVYILDEDCKKLNKNIPLEYYSDEELKYYSTKKLYYTKTTKCVFFEEDDTVYVIGSLSNKKVWPLYPILCKELQRNRNLYIKNVRCKILSHNVTL